MGCGTKSGPAGTGQATRATGQVHEKFLQMDRAGPQ